MENTPTASVMSLRTGRLLPGYVVLDEGVNAPMRGIAATPDGEISVIAKKIGTRTLAVEALCAVYGRSVGLPIPEPIFVFDDDLGWMFASTDVGHPNLNQFVTTDSIAMSERLLAWPHLLSAACFDELMVNSDRHDGNILYDGLDFTLIDHDLCLPSGMLADAAMAAHHSNALLDILIAALPEGDLGKRKLIKDSNAWIASRDDVSAQQAEGAITGLCTHETKDQLISFVRERLSTLTNLLAAKINPDQGRLDF
jgi:hypothetical protein